MVGGRLSCCFVSSLGLLLGLYLYNVEASGGKRVIHKQAGDSVELSPDVPTEGVTVARWKYGEKYVTKSDSGLSENNPFQDRLEFYTNFSLMIRKLTLQDSGEFSFVSGDEHHQRPTVFITLQVHEPLTQQPSLTANISQPSLNGSCSVSLECKAAPGRNVTYSWIVGKQTYKGPELQHSISTQDGAVTFTCTVTNVISNKSASLMETCINQTSTNGGYFMWILIGAVGGSLVLFIIITMSFCLCRRRQAASDSNELTVYADVSDFTHEDGMNLKPCSLYDTIENTTQTVVTQGPQTVYDKIQFDRMRKPSLSPYQDLS